MKSIFSSMSRRDFVATSLAAVSPVFFTKAGSTAAPDNPTAMTIAEVIEKIKSMIPSNIGEGTVDTIKSSNANQPVKGIVTTMFATIDVIQKAISMKANLIIAHEPTFYNHHDETDWIKDHSVYQFKRNLLEENKIVVWRFHDYWHATRPDGVLEGVLKKLEWTKYYNEATPFLLNIPDTPLGEIIQLTKRRLDIRTLRYIGELDDACKSVLFIPGAAGGRVHINGMQQHNPDLLICGELQEWETSEYIRDFRAMGKKRSLIVLGHVLSEEPGMEHLVQWLKPQFADLKISHVASGSPFIYT
jgi:putative NIF3 family GTP cyclohydrolase 1 type 2